LKSKFFMERRLKERLIGAAVLVMFAVILIPMVLDDTSEREISITKTNIPVRPKDDFNSRIVPLEESDLTPVPEKIPPLLDIKEQIDSPEDSPAALKQAQPAVVKAGDPVQVQHPAPERVKEMLRPQVSEKPENSHMGVTAWVVQLGSFSAEENAKGLNEKLRKAGYPAFVEPLNQESGVTAYRVRVGPEILRSDAEALQQKLKKGMRIDGIVIRYP
jgi:DedD protein